MSDMALEPEGTPAVPDGATAQQDAGTKTVPVERFNGLQRAHQEALAKLRAFEAQQASTSQPQPETPASTDPDPNSASVQFFQELMEDALDRWRDAAIAQYPAVKPLREYLTAENKAGVMELAKDLAEKLSGTAPASTEAPTVTTPTPPATPTVPAGSPALPTDQGADAEMEELRKEARRTGNWTPYLKRQRELAGWPF
jgi:hypothetical protein